MWEHTLSQGMGTPVCGVERWNWQVLRPSLPFRWGSLSVEKAVDSVTFFRVRAHSVRVGHTKVGAPIPSVEAESSLARALAEMFMEVGKLKPPELPGLLLKPGSFPSSVNNVVLQRPRNWLSSREIPRGQ